MRTSLAAISQADQTWHVRPEDPFATADRFPEGIDPDQVSRFGDPRWNYTVLSRRRSEGSKTVNWAAFPETLRESFRRAGWALVNLPTPAALLNRAATARVEWPAPGTMAQVFLGWRRFAVWLADHSVTSLPEVDHDLLAVVAMSHQTTGDIIQTSFKIGANGFLRKPLDEQQILKRIEMVLREYYL